jgi:hypothetical protein
VQNEAAGLLFHVSVNFAGFEKADCYCENRHVSVAGIFRTLQRWEEDVRATQTGQPNETVLWGRAQPGFAYSARIVAGSSKIEPRTTPARPLTLSWATFTNAANEAGISRRYGGIHFRRADLDGRLLGRLVAEKAWLKAQTYFDGTALPVIKPI